MDAGSLTVESRLPIGNSSARSSRCCRSGPNSYLLSSGPYRSGRPQKIFSTVRRQKCRERHSACTSYFSCLRICLSSRSTFYIASSAKLHAWSFAGMPFPVHHIHKTENCRYGADCHGRFSRPRSRIGIAKQRSEKPRKSRLFPIRATSRSGIQPCF